MNRIVHNLNLIKALTETRMETGRKTVKIEDKVKFGKAIPKPKGIEDLVLQRRKHNLHRNFYKHFVYLINRKVNW